MIDKKQNITQQILLSFKRDHGDFYQKFVNCIKDKVHYYRKVNGDRCCPPHMTAQKCIFFCILEKKHNKFKNKEQTDTSELAQLLKRQRHKIKKSVQTQKDCVLKKQINVIENIERSIVYQVTKSDFPFNSFTLVQNTYAYELMKAITGLKEEVGMLGHHKYVPFSYTERQIAKISQTFGQKIAFLDYNSNKFVLEKVDFNFQTTYILRIKEQYIILYVKEPIDIDLIKQESFTLQQVEAIFTATSISQSSRGQKQKGYFTEDFVTLSGKENQQAHSSRLFPQSIKCSKCHNQLSQFDCLKWNYESYCAECLQNPNLDTSDIPPSLIEKFFAEKGIKHDNFEIACPQCTGKTSFKKYNPAYKPTSYCCSICEFKICLLHSCDIKQCFCECFYCKQPTIYIGSVNLVICERCKTKHCRKCNITSEKICSCICLTCNERKQQGQTHVCEQRCHLCQNNINRLKKCVCGQKLCYGCYYFKLRTVKGVKAKMICKGKDK